MRSFVIGFLLGNSFLLLWRHLPTEKILLFLLLIALAILILNIFFYELPIANLLIGFLLGFFWISFSAEKIAVQTLPNKLPSPLVLQGKVISLPQVQDYKTSFIFTPIPNHLNLPSKILLNWYSPPDLQIGDMLQIMVRLKKPRGYWNIFGFDYQKWLFNQGIRATGYVVNYRNNVVFHCQKSNYRIDSLRAQIDNAIEKNLRSNPCAGLVSALAVGIRNDITPAQWTTMRGTGTNHLFAIAGLHIGIVSSIIYFIVSFIWRRWKKLPLYSATSQVSCVAVLIAAYSYSAFAGFSLPTQRAMIMLGVFLLANLLRKNLLPWTAWCLSLLCVLLFDPLIVMDASFWLSFGAVGLILYGINGRLAFAHIFFRWSRIQWFMTFGLIPLSLLFFHQISLAAFIANAIAIPWVGFIVLPIILLGNLFWVIFPTATNYFWIFAGYALKTLWPVLEYIGHCNHLQLQEYLTSPVAYITGFIGIILLLAPKKLPAKYIGIIWLLPMFLLPPPLPADQEVSINLLDARNTLIVIVQTRHHVCIYISNLSARGSIVNSVLVPCLQAHKINLINKLFINDMADTQNLLDEITSNQIEVSQTFSSANDIWQWDGTNFQSLFLKNNSNILRIEIGRQSILILPTSNQGLINMLVHKQFNLLPNAILILPIPVTTDQQFIIPKLKAMSIKYILYAGKDDYFDSVNLLTGKQGQFSCELNAEGKIKISNYLENQYGYWDE